MQLTLIQLSLLLGAYNVPRTLAQDAPPATHDERFPNGLDELNYGVNGGLNGVSGTSYTKTQWAWGTLPRVCWESAVWYDYCNPYDMEVYDVEYDDCETTTTMCRCNNAQMSIDDMAVRFGKIPVKARQWANYVSAYAADGCSAYSMRDDITLFGACDGQTIFIHELGHSLDHATGITLFPGQSYSGTTTEWASLVGMGTCVPDNYAKSSWAESWAQVAVMAAYDALVQPIWNVADLECMADQMDKSIEQLSPLFTPEVGQTCDRAWPKDPTVCMGPEAETQGACDSLVKKSTDSINQVRSASGGVTIQERPALSPDAQRKVAQAEHARVAHAEAEVAIFHVHQAAGNSTAGRRAKGVARASAGKRGVTRRGTGFSL